MWDSIANVNAVSLKVEDLQEIAVAPRFDRDQLRYLRTTVLHTDVELESRRQLVACPLLGVL